MERSEIGPPLRSFADVVRTSGLHIQVKPGTKLMRHPVQRKAAIKG
jgi:hypothetical protein